MRRFLLLLLFINQISNATTYYVAKNGNDRNNGVTLPFLTIQRGVNALKAGDTLFVRDGVYTERIVISDHNSTANSPIVISAFRGERPVIDGAGLDLGGNGNGLVSIFSPYVRFNGFEVRNVDMTGRYTDHMAVYLNGNDILSNCIVHNAYHGGVQICGNNNLMEYTTPEVVEQGISILEECSRLTGLPFKRYLVLDAYQDIVPDGLGGKQRLVMSYTLKKPWEGLVMKGI